MRTPKRGEAYQVCVHLADEAAAAEKHYWRLPQKRWLMLCATCHTSYSKRTAVNVEALLRLFSSTPDLGPAAAEAIHVATRNPPSRILSLNSRSPQPEPQADFALLKLRLSVQEVTMSMFLPSRIWLLPEVRKRLRSLRANYRKQQRTHETDPANPHVLSQLSEIDRALTHIELRVHVVLRTRRQLAVVIRQAQRLLARTLSKPFGGYFYRRRIFRKLMRERQMLASLLWAMNVQDSILPADLTSAMQDTFVALQRRYGMPLSDAAMRRMVGQTPLADVAELASALQHCECRACIHARKNTPLDDELDMAALATCPCAFCKFTRTTMPKIDMGALAKHPDLRDGILALRQQIGGTFN